MTAGLNNTSFNDIHLTMYDHGSIQGDKGTSKGSKVEIGAKGGKEGEDPLADLLRDYEKAKAKMESNLAPISINDLKNSAIGQALKNDPVWQAATSPTPTQTHIDPNATKNFFLLIFKFLKNHKEADSEVQVAQAVNLLAKGKILDQVTQGSVASLNDMKTKIQKAKDNENSALSGFLKIGLPIILAVVSVVIIVATLGAATPAVAAGDAAGAGTLAATDAAVATTTDVTAEGAAESAVSTLSITGDQAAEGAGEAMEMTEMGGETAETAGASAGAADESASTTANTASNVARQGAQKAAQTAAKTAEKTAEKTLTQTIKQAATKFWAVAKNPMLVTGVLAPVNVTVDQQASAKVDNDLANAMSEATSDEQGEMAVNTAASDGLQNDIKSDMNYEQNAQQEEEADASMEQQTIQASTKIYSLGNF